MLVKCIVNKLPKGNRAIAFWDDARIDFGDH